MAYINDGGPRDGELPPWGYRGEIYETGEVWSCPEERCMCRKLFAPLVARRERSSRRKAFMKIFRDEKELFINSDNKPRWDKIRGKM